MKIIETKDLNFWYGNFHALKNINMEIESNSVTAFIGPSGCGKSTYLRLFNRMNDLIQGTRLNTIGGQRSYFGQKYIRKGHRCRCSPQESGHGLPKTQSFCQKHFR